MPTPEIIPTNSTQEEFNAVFDLWAIATLIVGVPSAIAYGITYKKIFLYIAFGMIGIMFILLGYEQFFLRPKRK